jgi:hypothetical protein
MAARITRIVASIPGRTHALAAENEAPKAPAQEASK